MTLGELKGKMKGVFIVMMTPFTEEGVDYEGLRTNVRYLLPQIEGKDFILTPVGSTGEFYAMNDEERKKVIKIVVEEVKGRVPVVAGTAQAGTLETVRMTKYAEEVGCDGAQIVLPYYHTPSAEGIYLHFKEIAEAVNPDFGLMIYNNPAVSGSWVPPPLMARLSEIPNLIADKENTPYFWNYRRMVEAVDPKKMVVIQGLGEIPFSFCAVHGCPGFVSGFANVAPLVSYTLYQAAMNKDFSGLQKAVDRVVSLYKFMGKVNTTHGPSLGVQPGAQPYMPLSMWKSGQTMLGLCGGKVRLPITELTDAEKDELRGILVSMGLKVVK